MQDTQSYALKIHLNLKQELRQLLEKSQAEKEALKKTFQKFKQKKTKDLDTAFHVQHTKVFKKIISGCRY